MSDIQYPAERNLDGVYFRVVRGGKSVTRCFTDLTVGEQNNILDKYEKESLYRMCKILADTLRGIGDQFDIINQE